jgi:GT2 family glycosyltransferase
MSVPELSVLLVSWNTREETRRCLDSLRQTAAELSYEVVAVDNGSRDGSAELLAADNRVQLIRNEHNVGFAAAVNQAYRAATGELILLLNTDVTFHDGALQTMVDFLREHPGACGVSPLYLNPDGSLQQHYVQLPSLAACLALFTVLRRVPGFRAALHRFEMRGQSFSTPRELASGSCQLLRRRALAADQIFDENFPIYWNDALLARELTGAGHRLWMIPDAVVTHTRGASCSRLGPSVRFRHLIGGLVQYLERTGPHYRVFIFRAAMIANHLLKTAFGRATPLGWADLRAALRADLGPLPDGDTTGWAVVVGRQSDETWLEREPQAAEPDVRLVLVDPEPPQPHRRFAIHQVAPSVWRASLPSPLPLGWLTVVRWLNRRIAAAQLRQWLDGHAGARTLHVSPADAYLIGWLGEDLVAQVRTDDSRGLAA